MNKKTRKFLNNLYPYFKMLNNININLTKIINGNKNNEPYQNEELFYNITSELLRLFPYKRDKKTGKLYIDKESGILLLSKKIIYIEDKYDIIINFEKFHEVLKDVLKIRNKYIHEPHNISYAFSLSGTSTCSMNLYYKTQLLHISTVTLAPIIYYLNKIFDKIKKDALAIIEQDSIYKSYPYYDTLVNFDFSRKTWNYTVLPDYLILGF